MEENYVGYVYDKYGMFWNESFTPEQLKQMEDSKHPEIRYIRYNLYSKKVHSDEDKIIFVNTDKPYFRKWNISDAERNGFSSVYETRLHKACKTGIAMAKQIRIRLCGKDYILRKKWSDIETSYSLLGNKYETDCEFAILNIDDELQTLLAGDVLNFEVHHKSKVKPKKMMAYQISGINMFEFDIQMKYLPFDVKNENLDDEEMIRYFTEYYENVEKHYISGVFYPPFISSIEWNGGISRVYDFQNDKEIEIKIYKDHYSKKKCYNIVFICGDKTYTQFEYDGKKIEDFYDAKRYANYLIEMHKQEKIIIPFK